eukprot:Em0022g769a
MKLMLVGKQNRGKTTLAARLQGRSCGNTSTVGVDVNEWEYKPSIGKKSFQFSIWDFGGQEEYYVTHQCFLSERALYLVLFNLLHGVEGMRYLQHKGKEKADKLLQKAADIAGGFCNKLQIYQVMAVGLKDPLEGVTDLRDSIYQCAAEYKFSNGEFVMGQKIPLSYSKLDKHILWFQKRARQCNLIPIMNKEEFKALVKDLSLTDIHGDNELKLATTFLTDIGTLLYYDDRSHHLDELYFLDPQWLCDIMAKQLSNSDWCSRNYWNKGFIAPEVLHVGKKREHSLYDHRADIFSFGMFLYQMIYRRHPFHDMLPVRIDSAVENGERPRLMQCCWQADPRSRPATAEIIDKLCLSSFQSLMSKKYFLKLALVIVKVATLIAVQLAVGERHSDISPRPLIYWSNPLTSAKKFTEKKQDSKESVNSMTQKEAYPLPRIDETLEALTGSQFFTTLDLASGYWQVEMEEADRKKTAFSTREGHFEFNVMPFGLTNAPATFQRLVECVLAGLTYEQCLIYLDDIVVFSVTFDKHLERLKMVFHHLAEAGLKLKPNKCHFAKSEIRYLGHIVSRQGIQADPDKTSAMISFPVPSDIKELRQFLGLTNYYRRFIKGYSSIAEPLHKLTRKTEGGFKWNSECQNAFQHLKHLLVSPPILAYPQFQLPFVVTLDASSCAIGAVLSQEHEGEESDQGANFVSEVMQSLCTQLGIKRTQTSAYHPEGNGPVECFNRTLEAMLSKVVEEHQKDWDCHLQKVLFAFRTAVHESTGYTPLFVMSGRSPNLPIDVLLVELKLKVKNFLIILKPCHSDPEPESDAEIKNPEPSSSKQVTPEDNNTHMEVVQDMTLPEVLEDETVIPVEDTILENEDHVILPAPLANNPTRDPNWKKIVEPVKDSKLSRPDLQGSKLTTEEKNSCMKEFSELFDDGELGRTSKIRHAITTFGPPIRQPIHRFPVALKKTVQEEVQKMLKNKPHGDHNTLYPVHKTDSKNWRPIHSEANRDVFMTLTAMVIEMFGSKSGDTIFPTGRVLCKTCHSSVQSIPKLEKKLLDLNQQIREQLRHAGLPNA